MLIFKLDFRRMPQINSVRGLSSIKAISKYGQSDKRFSRYRVQKQLWTDGRIDRWTGPLHKTSRLSTVQRPMVSDKWSQHKNFTLTTNCEHR